MGLINSSKGGINRMIKRQAKKLSAQDWKEVILKTLLGLFVIPLFVGCFVALICSQDTNFFGYWWLGFSKQGIIWTLVLEVVVTLTFAIMYYFRINPLEKDEKGRDVSETPVYGDAHFQTEEEIKKNYTVSRCRDANRVIFGSLDEERKVAISQRKRVPGEKPDNNNMAIVAASGSGKSTAVLMPMIMQLAKAGENMLITDPRSEQYGMMAKYLERMGYDVFVFSTKKDAMPNSDRFNPLDFLDQDINKILSLAGALLELKDDVLSDYFASGELTLFIALCCFFTNPDMHNDPGTATIPYMYTYLTSMGSTRICQDLKRIPQGAPGYEASRAFINNPSRHEDFISGLHTKLQKYTSKACAEMLSQSDFEPLDFVDNKAVVFLIMDDNDPVFDSLTRCFFSIFVRGIIDLADRFPGDPTRGMKPRNIYPAFNLILEETNNIGKIETLDRIISTVRGRNMNTVLTFQNIDQIKDTYEEKRESLLSACHTQLFFGINDESTSEYVSKWLGTKTVTTNTRSRPESNVKPVEIHLSENHRYQDVAVPLLTPEQTKEVTKDHVLVRTMGKQPMMLYPFTYWYHDDSDLIEEESVYMRLVVRKRPKEYYERFGIPYKDPQERIERKKRIKEFYVPYDIDKHYEEQLGVQIVERPGIMVDQVEPELNPHSASLDRKEIKPKKEKDPPKKTVVAVTTVQDEQKNIISQQVREVEVETKQATKKENIMGPPKKIGDKEIPQNVQKHNGEDIL